MIQVNSNSLIPVSSTVIEPEKVDKGIGTSVVSLRDMSVQQTIQSPRNMATQVSKR